MNGWIRGGGRAGVALLGFAVGSASGQIAPQNLPPATAPTARPAAAEQQLPTPFPPLNAQQADQLAKVLGAWERGSQQIKVFECEFERYDFIVALGQNDLPARLGSGVLKYSKPDKGRYQIANLRPRGPNGWKPGAPGDDWYCDGENVYEIDHAEKQVVRTPIPPNLQGEAIRHGPLPFLFGMTATELQNRYWLSEVAAKQFQPKGEAQPRQVWQLSAAPKWAADASNYRKVDIMLTLQQKEKLLLPLAVRIEQPNGDKQSYSLDIANAKINPVLPNLLKIFQPTLPPGYKVVDQPMNPAPTEQAQRPTGAPPR